MVNTNSIFQESWWLDAVAPGQRGIVEVEKGGKVEARMPYVKGHNSFGLKTIIMPPLTKTLGPWLAPSKAKYTKQLALQKSLMTALIGKLPPYDYFEQNFHYSITNWLPFYWRGFSQSTRYTYVLEDLTDLDRVWNSFRENIRREIRKAKKRVVCRTETDIDRFLDINTLTFKRQGRKLPYDRELVHRLDVSCVAHNARQIYFAEDAHGEIHAAIYIIWDANSCYYLMGGTVPEFRNSGATSLLMWEAIQFAATVTKKFDFEGSMIESVERFFRGFGARQIPYFQITRMSNRMKFLMAGRNMIKALLNS